MSCLQKPWVQKRVSSQVLVIKHSTSLCYSFSSLSQLVFLLVLHLNVSLVAFLSYCPHLLSMDIPCFRCLECCFSRVAGPQVLPSCSPSLLFFSSQDPLGILLLILLLCLSLSRTRDERNLFLCLTASFSLVLSLPSLIFC